MKVMTSQISGPCLGPCCESDIEPDQYESFVWESLGMLVGNFELNP